MIYIDSSIQKLYLFRDDTLVFESKISTSLYGMGCLEDTFKTPTGLHLIASKIGSGLPAGTLFKHRKPTDQTIKQNPPASHDYITSRILRLSGLEEGINKGGNVDSYRRYIYIHGTPHSKMLGSASSHGCIRMSDNDVIELFDLVNENSLVLID